LSLGSFENFSSFSTAFTFNAINKQNFKGVKIFPFP
jgi:hypothetical protein